MVSDGTVKQLQIDVWSDINCPWCYIGEERLRQAIDSSPDGDSIHVVHHAFELDPNASREPKPTLLVISEMMGMSTAQARQFDARTGEMASSEGLPYTSDRPHANTFDAHRLVSLAGAEGVSAEVLRDLRTRFFGAGANIFDHQVLRDAATTAGIASDRAEAVLGSQEFADVVRADEAEAARLGATGVPFSVFGRRRALSGASTVEGYAQAIENAFGEV